MSRKPKKGYFVRGHFVAEGSELDLELKRELKGGDAPSKTELKAQSAELQALGEALLELRRDLFEPLDLPPKLIDALAGRLVHARTEHPASQWAGAGDKFAHNAISSEVGEVWDAMRWETPERVKSELLDVLATSVRAHNDEHK